MSDRTDRELSDRDLEALAAGKGPRYVPVMPDRRTLRRELDAALGRAAARQKAAAAPWKF